MAEASIVDREDVGVRLSDEVAKCVCSPTLSNVAGVAMDFFAVLAWIEMLHESVVEEARTADYNSSIRR